MLTVKVMKSVEVPDEIPKTYRYSTKIVEAEEVNIHILRPGELYEVAGVLGGKSFVFYIADPTKPRPTDFADEVEFWYAAYVENSVGATVEVVRP